MRAAINFFIEDLVKPINPSSIILLGLFTVLWGIWLVLPFFQVFTSGSLFSFLASLAPEWAWGVNAIVCGSLTVYGVCSKRYGPLATGTAIATWHWFIVALFLLLGDWTNTGWLVYGFLSIVAALTRLNIKLSHKSKTPVEEMFIK